MFGTAELREMQNACVTTILGVCGLVVVGGSLLWLLLSFHEVGCDYTKCITVDDSSKIERAISNVVNDVKSRNFVVTKLVVDSYKNREFRVKCGGVDRGNLLKR